MDYRISLIGLLIGFLVGLTGMGGGALLAPIMILVMRVPPVWAVGTDITYSAITKALGSVVHIQQKTFSTKNLKIAFWLGCGSVPATILGVGLVQYIRKNYGDAVNGIIIHAIGFTLVLVAILLIAKPFIMRLINRKNLEKQKQAALESETTGEAASPASPTLWEKRYRPLITLFIGAFVGFLVGLTSVGSGTLIIVALAFLYPRLATKELVGADIVHGLVLNIAGAIVYFTAGTINWTIVGLLLIGSLPGVFLGSKLSKYIPDRIMRPVLATVLVISGWKLI